MSREDGLKRKREVKDATTETIPIVTVLQDKIMEMIRVESLNEETTRMVERMVVLRLSTKHINMWMRQLELKRKEMSELAGWMKLEEVKEEIQKERSLERWAK